MKRGFEENVPRVRPRVRLGRELDDMGEESEAGPEEQVPEGPPPQLELAPPPQASHHEPAFGGKAADVAGRVFPDSGPPPRAFEPPAAPVPPPVRVEPSADAFHAIEQRKPADPRPPEPPPRSRASSGSNPTGWPRRSTSGRRRPSSSSARCSCSRRSETARSGR